MTVNSTWRGGVVAGKRVAVSKLYVTAWSAVEKTAGVTLTPVKVRVPVAGLKPAPSLTRPPVGSVYARTSSPWT